MCLHNETIERSGIAPLTGTDVVLFHDAEEFPVKVLRRRHVNKPLGAYPRV